MSDSEQRSTNSSAPTSFMHYARRCGSPKIFYYSLYYLTAVLIIGTITQADLGIYGAQERYFSAWVTWTMGCVPVPGGRLTLALISLNLICKLLLRTRWTARKIGINISHIGMFLLMFGALLTAYFSVEGSMFIKEGQFASYYTESDQIAVKIIDVSDESKDYMLAFSGPHLSVGTILTHSQKRWSGTVRVEAFYRNTNIQLCDEKTTGDWRGYGRMHTFTEKKLEKEQSRNMPIVILQVDGFDAASNGRYMLTTHNKSLENLNHEGKQYQLGIGFRVHALPNNVQFQLIDFKAEYHPGTGKPSAYSSQLRIIENGAAREALISMNEPLRMHSHTFYQSSFQQRNGEESSILSVVKNEGRMFPYISSIIMCIGLCIHLLLFVMTNDLKPGIARGARNDDDKNDKNNKKSAGKKAETDHA